MGDIVQFPRKPRAGSVYGPPVHHSVGVGTIVALLRAHRVDCLGMPDLEEKARLDVWLASDALPGEWDETFAAGQPSHGSESLS